MLDDHRLRWTLGLGATARHRHDGACCSPAPCATPGSASGRLRVRATRRSAGCSRCRLDARLRGVPTRSSTIVIRNLAEPGSGDAAAYFDAFTFFVLPHGLLAVSIATTFAAGDGERRRPHETAGVRRPHVARRAADRAAHAAGRRGAVRAAPADHRRRCCSTASSTPADAAEHVTRARRVRPRPGRVLGLPVHVPRVLRPPGHPHAVHASTSARTCSTSCLAFVLVGRWGVLGLGRAFAVVVPAVGGVGAAGDVATRCPASRSAVVLVALCADGAGRARDRARPTWFVAPAASAATPASRRWCGCVVRHASSASPSTSGCSCCCKAPEIDRGAAHRPRSEASPEPGP